MNKTLSVILTVVATILVLAILFFTLVPAGRIMWNDYTHSLKKADEGNYETRKEVENIVQSMIKQYDTDVLTYFMFRNSNVEAEREYATVAKLQAIRTAASYNDFILKIKYVWGGNIPSEIPYALDLNLDD